MSPNLTSNLIDAVFLLLGKGGKFLNARGNRICFLIDLFCLTYWFYIDLHRELYAQAVSVLVSAAIAVYGYRRWGRKPPN